MKIRKIANGAGISNGQTIQKFANVCNFENFPNKKENLNSKNI